MNARSCPGATIGVLGSGQLGRMFAIAARRMGYRVHTFSPETRHADRPGGRPRSHRGLRRPGRGARVRARRGRRHLRVRERARRRPRPPRPNTRRSGPRGNVLHTTQHRLREKTFSRPARASRSRRSRPIRLARSSAQAVANAGLSRRAEDRRLRLRRQRAGRSSIGPKTRTPPGTRSRRSPAVLEAFVDFEREVSVVAARGLDGVVRPLTAPSRTSTCNHILDVSVAPAPMSPTKSTREAVEIARAVLEELDVVGVLCVEFFVTARRRAAGQRARAAAAQLRPPHVRRLRDQPVRAATARRLRPAARLDRAAPPRRHGQPARRPLGGRRAGLGRGLRVSRTSSCTSTASPTRARAARWAISRRSATMRMQPFAQRARL